MANDVIREVEDDPREGVVVTVEESAADVQIPPCCAGCLGEATMRLPPAGVNWLEFPYCEDCAPEGAREALDRRREKAGAGCFWLLGPLLYFVGQVVRDTGGPRGGAVKLLLGPGGTVRLGFRNREYARRFVEANGAEMPPETA